MIFLALSPLAALIALLLARLYWEHYIQFTPEERKILADFRKHVEMGTNVFNHPPVISMVQEQKNRNKRPEPTRRQQICLSPRSTAESREASHLRNEHINRYMRRK